MSCCGGVNTAQAVECPTGFLSLNDYIDYNKSAVTNATNDSYIKSILQGSGHLKSDEDVDEQLLLFIAFTEKCKLRGIKVTVNENKEGNSITLKKVAIFIMFVGLLLEVVLIGSSFFLCLFV